MKRNSEICFIPRPMESDPQFKRPVFLKQSCSVYKDILSKTKFTQDLAGTILHKHSGIQIIILN
jgi:hypothetical protein